MQNLRPDELHGRASYLSGRHKPMYMMEGLDDSFDAALFISYHGSASSTSSVLHHTYNPRAIAEVRLNGELAGEAGVNALVALAYRVPVVLISGDRITIDEVQPFCPEIESVVVKESVSHNAALSLHPERARELIREGTHRGLARLADFRLPTVTLPAELTVRFHNRAFAELACALRGVEQREEKVVAIRADDPLQLFRTFIATVLLSRGVSE
jgi:D-amino peptidase